MGHQLRIKLGVACIYSIDALYKKESRSATQCAKLVPKVSAISNPYRTRDNQLLIPLAKERSFTLWTKWLQETLSIILILNDIIGSKCGLQSIDPPFLEP